MIAVFHFWGQLQVLQVWILSHHWDNTTFSFIEKLLRKLSKEGHSFHSKITQNKSIKHKDCSWKWRAGTVRGCEIGWILSTLLGHSAPSRILPRVKRRPYKVSDLSLLIFRVNWTCPRERGKHQHLSFQLGPVQRWALLSLLWSSRAPGLSSASLPITESIFHICRDGWWLLLSSCFTKDAGHVSRERRASATDVAVMATASPGHGPFCYGLYP